MIGLFKDSQYSLLSSLGVIVYKYFEDCEGANSC